MDRGAWWATVHRVARVRHNLLTKPPPHTYIHTYAYIQTHAYLHISTYMSHENYFPPFIYFPLAGGKT